MTSFSINQLRNTYNLSYPTVDEKEDKEEEEDNHSHLEVIEYVYTSTSQITTIVTQRNRNINIMADNVQCPVCTLYLLPGMDLSDHLETHPKEQVIKALVQLSLKSEVSEIVTPDTPKKAKNLNFLETSSSHPTTEDERTTPLSEISGSGSASGSTSNGTSVLPAGINEKRRNTGENVPSVSVTQNTLLNRQMGYLIENNSNSSSSSSSNFYGPPTPYYRHHNHHHHQPQNQQQQQQLQQQASIQQQQQQQPQQQQQQQQQSQSHSQSQQPHHNHLQNYHPYHGHQHGGQGQGHGPGPAQPPLRLFSYQPSPKPLQPPPAYGAAISQLRSQNSQNVNLNNVNRPLYPSANYTSTPTSSTSSSSSATSTVTTRLPPPLPPPPLNQRYQPSFPHLETSFSEACENNGITPSRTSMTPPIRPPPQLYRSPLSSSGQCSRQSNSPYSTMAGSPSVLRFAESPVTAHYLERENGDFIVQETPKHVVECVEKDDGEFSVIERVYHVPPSVVQINEDKVEELSEDNASNSEDIKTVEDDRTSGTSSGGRSPEQAQISQQRQQKKSGITVLSNVQLDLHEYLDLMGNIIALSKAAKTRTETVKIEKFDPEEVKEETSGTMCLEEEEEPLSPDNERNTPQMKEKNNHGNDLTSCPVASTSASVTESPGTTSVIRLAANSNARSNTPPTTAKVEKSLESLEANRPSTKVEGEIQVADIGLEISKVEGAVQVAFGEEPFTSMEDEETEPSNCAAPTIEIEETIQAISISASTSTSLDNSPKRVIERMDEAPGTSEKNTNSRTANKIENHIKSEKSDRRIKEEIHVHKEEATPTLAYQQHIRRPIKKVPKKLIIKPKNKDVSATSARASSTASTLATMPSTSTQHTHMRSEQNKATTTTEEEQNSAEKETNTIKIENVSMLALETIPPPLFADADEKLPPEDDVQASTSREVMSNESDSRDSSKEKPTPDLAAFLDDCMKKEEVEEHPMHSIFGMEIEGPPETLNGELAPSSPVFPSASLFSKPIVSSEHLPISESILPDSSEMHGQDQHQPQHQQQQQQTTAYVEYPFSFLYSAEANQQEENRHNSSPPMYCTEDFNKYSASTSGGNSASCTWYQSQSSENDFEIDGKGSYLDLDSIKRSGSFAAATEGSMPTADALNIRTDEKMPAKGEISEQESNCGVENSWSQPLYNEFPVRFPNPYQNFMTTNESWSNDHFFRPQDLSSSVQAKNFGLRLTDESPILDALPSTSKRKNKTNTKVPRKKTFQCTHCNTQFPLLKEKNAHLIKQHGYKRVNRRLVRDPPTSTVTTATLNAIDANASMLLGLDTTALPPPPLAEEEDSKAAIVKIEQENQEQKDCKKNISSLAITSTTQPANANSISRTKYDSMRARDNRMLINFNLNALNVKNEGEAHTYFMESKSSFCCFVCRRDFLTVKLFDEHLSEHPAECFTCHKKFTRWKNFMVHLKRHLGWKDFGCTFCEKKFVIRSALVEHMRMHTGQTPLKCKICGKSFKRYSNLTQHRKRHGTKINRSKEYVCYCGEVLPSKARFIWHKETHDIKPKCCPYCRDRFVHANSLRRHIRLAHSDKFDYTEPMECPMCKQIYAKSSIKAHMATHTIDTQHECLICNKSFSTKWNLKIHNWVHANRTTKPFKCDQCVKAFVREVDFNNHINSHKQIKPYTCEHCGCKFIRKYNYIRHRREHHGNKKFTCDLCGKLFHRHYYLIEHRRIHTGERPFQCTICGKSSTTKTNHNKHLKIHHSRDPFTSEA